jgi:muramoyltetrapeptide carboxypeptidase
VEEIILDCIKEYDFPVAFGFPVGHDKANVALKTSVPYELRVTPDQTFLSERGY